MLLGDNVHKSHRERVRQKFSEVGFEGWREHEILEMMLFYVMPRIDTNPIAHRLIEEFGSLAGVLEAQHSALTKVSGIGSETATYICALGKLQSEYGKSKWEREKVIFASSATAGRYCVDYIGNETEEVLGVVCLDTAYSVKNRKIISRGMIDRVDVNIRRIVETAFASSAKFLVLCHNHPSGGCIPSQQDIDVTNSIVSALKPLDIELCDHIVVGGGGFTSMAERGYIKN